MTERYSEIKSLINRALTLLEEEMNQTKKEMEASFNKAKESMIQEIKNKDAEIEELKKKLKASEKSVSEVHHSAPKQKEEEETLFPQEIFPSQNTPRKPEPLYKNDGDENIFTIEDDDTNMFEIIVKENDKKPTILGELFSSKGVIGEKGNNLPRWRTDRPGIKVNNIEEAISLNDRVYFLRELFGGDNEQYELTLERIDECNSFDDIVSEMRITFPNWDESSDAVYRFYMAIRRKF